MNGLNTGDLTQKGGTLREELSSKASRNKTQYTKEKHTKQP